MFSLRDYQLEALEKLRKGIRDGHRRQILCAPTGSGKTIIAAAMIERVQANGRKAVFVADRRALVRQTSERLHEAGIRHGVVMAGESFGRYEPIQVCSAQTLERREFWPDLDLVIIDEAHTVRKQTVQLIGSFEKPVVGLTATPFTLGLGKIYSNVVTVRSTDSLVNDGWLVPVRVFCGVQIDMTGAPVAAGEWSDKTVEDRATPLTGDIVSEWVRMTRQVFGKPVKTLVFSATVDHGTELCRQFQMAGYRFEQVSYKDGQDQSRVDKIKAFREGLIDGLVSCEALSKGFDVPDALCLVNARPYRKSLASHIQQLGRIMRPSPGKAFGLVLDHADNYRRHVDATEDFWASGLVELDDGHRKPKAPAKQGPREAYTCNCGFVLPQGATRCPMCGAERRIRPNVSAQPGTMVEHISLRDIGDLWPHVSRLAMDRHPTDPERAQRFAGMQFKLLTGKSAWGRPLRPGPECHPRVVKAIERNLRSWRRRKQKDDRK